MSPHRDPETGKFVAGSGSRPSNHFDRYESFSGTLSVQIPAADAAGGTAQEQWTGDNGLVIDFDDELDNDEIFRMQSLDMTVSLALPTTATAESSAVVTYAVADDATETMPFLSRTSKLTALTVQDDEEGILDIVRAQSEDDVMLSGALYAEASIADTVNALAAGADYANETRSFRPWDHDQTVDFDESDELIVNGELESRNVSDHHVIFTTYVTVHGWVDDFD